MLFSIPFRLLSCITLDLSRVFSPNGQRMVYLDRTKLVFLNIGSGDGPGVDPKVRKNEGKGTNLQNQLLLKYTLFSSIIYYIIAKQRQNNNKYHIYSLGGVSRGYTGGSGYGEGLDNGFAIPFRLLSCCSLDLSRVFSPNGQRMAYLDRTKLAFLNIGSGDGSRGWHKST